jgi:hypothetical protein
VRIRSCVAAVVLAGCTVPSIGPLDFRNHGVQLDDDGSELAVTGCLSGIVGTCSQPEGSDAMTITADGVTHDIPVVSVPPDPDVLGDPGAVEFRGTVPAPTGSTVDVELAGEGGPIDLPSAFAITPPPDPVSRATSPLVIAFQPLPGATADADETITCGGERYELHDLSASSGQLVLDLFDGLSTGTCVHEVQLHQRVALPAGSGLSGTAARTETITFQTR